MSNKITVVWLECLIVKSSDFFFSLRQFFGFQYWFSSFCSVFAFDYAEKHFALLLAIYKEEKIVCSWVCAFEYIQKILGWGYFKEIVWIMRKLFGVSTFSHCLEVIFIFLCNQLCIVVEYWQVNPRYSESELFIFL